MNASLLILVVLAASPAADGGQARVSKADRLVDQALEAELEGDNAKRQGLLKEALRVSPQCEAARWQTGQVRVGRKWMTLAELQKAATEDPLLERYRRVRDEAYNQPPLATAHLTLARWCRQSKLAELERFHWLKLLELSPNEPEALAGLGLCWHEGQLMGRDEVAESQAARRTEREWSRRLQDLAVKLQSHHSDEATAAWERFRGISDPAATAALETEIAPRSPKLGLAVVDTLGKMRSHLAAASLIRLTESPFEEVRAAALAKLKQRSRHQTIPHVLAGMRWPIELQQEVDVSSQGRIEYEATVTTEDPQVKTITKTTASTIFSDVPVVNVSYSGSGRRVYPTIRVSGLTPEARYAARQRTAEAYREQSQRDRQRVDAYNREAQKQNQTASQLLHELTGENFGPDPQRWIDWWMSYNEYERKGEKPVYTRDYDRPQFVRDGLSIQVKYRYESCFARGTPIWTQNGSMPVEQIQPGDLVLSQDSETGELAYKPVFAATLRRPSPLRRIYVEGEEIAATLGHPFWVTGDGWRMAKELENGQRLHGLEGSLPIRKMDELPEAEAYNLVVDDFHTYFVGRQGLLVHDNNFREPTTAVLPGLQRVCE